MSFKKKYIKLNDDNLELETFSLPTDTNLDNQNDLESNGIPSNKQFHESFSNYFQPYTKMNSETDKINQEEEDDEDQIEGAAVNTTTDDSSDSENKNIFLYPNETYNKIGLSYGETSFIKRIWYGPEFIKDSPPTFRESSFLYRINEFPRYLAYRINKPTRILILLLLSTLHLFITAYFFYLPYISTSENIIPLECNSRINYPSSNNNACGLNLEKCTPFETSKATTVRCPALCDQGGLVYAPIAVGDKRIRYESYVIGEDYYRADSFVCAAAYKQLIDKESSNEAVKIKKDSSQKGGLSYRKRLISRIFGGCVQVKHVGAQLDFPTTENIQFDSFYPSSYVLEEAPFSAACIDPRFYVLAINLVFFGIIFYFFESKISFWWLMIQSFFFQSLVMDPAITIDPRDITTFAELVSLTVQKLLPLCFILHVLYSTTIERTFDDNYVSSIWKMGWLATFWLGLLNNITFDRLPVDRLTISDLKEQSGGLAATGFIFTIIITSAFVQGYSVWKAGLFRQHFKLYITMIISLILLSLLPGFGLRIHHYILGMLLLPGCGTRGKSAYILQGVLVGLILNGIGRWDFASIIETQRALLRGSAGDLSKPPVFIHNSTMKDIVSWSSPTKDLSYIDSDLTGFSFLLNDMEVYVGTNTTITIPALMKENKLVDDLISGALMYEKDVKLYLRIAMCDVLDSSNRGDYTNAAILYYPSGNWTDPLPGVS
ncbi:hypothetical protein ACO0SA_003113 [Hanseniaspora valbyensis]